MIWITSEFTWWNNNKDDHDDDGVDYDDDNDDDHDDEGDNYDCDDDDNDHMHAYTQLHHTYVPVYSVFLVQSSMSMLGRPIDIEICVD